MESSGTSPADAADAEEGRSLWWDIGLATGLSTLLAASHFLHFVTDSEFAHFGDLVSAFTALNSGHPFVLGPELAETGITLGGPMFYWLSYPSWLFENPVVGIHVWYFALEWGSLAAWLCLGRWARLHRHVLWISAFLLVVYPENRQLFCENLTVAAYLGIPLFMSGVVGLRARHWAAMIAPGVLLGLSFMVHHLAAVFIGAFLLVLLLRRPLPLAKVAVLSGVMLLTYAPVTLLVPTTTNVHDVERLFADDLYGLVPNPVDWLLTIVHYGRYSLFVPVLVVAAFAGGFKAGERHGLQLAIPWFAGVFLVVTAYLALISNLEGAYRMGIANPARALVASVALVWLLESARGRLPRQWRAVASPDLLLTAGCIAGTLLLGGGGLYAKARWDSYFEQVRQTQCTNRLLGEDFNKPSYISYVLYRAMAEAGLGAPASVHSQAPVGWNVQFIPNALSWLSYHQDGPGQSADAGDRIFPVAGLDSLPVLPYIGPLASADLENLRSHGYFQTVDGIHRWSAMSGDRGVPAFGIPEQQDDQRRLWVQIEYGSDLAHPGTSGDGASCADSGGALRLADVTVHPTATSCDCPEPLPPGMGPQGVSSFDGWLFARPSSTRSTFDVHLLFDLPSLEPMPPEISLVLPAGVRSSWRRVQIHGVGRGRVAPPKATHSSFRAGAGDLASARTTSPEP